MTTSAVATSVPSQPGRPVIVSYTDNSATVRWTQVDGLTYKLYAMVYGASTYTFVSSDLGYVSEGTVTGLTQGTRYTIVVEAHNSFGASTKSPNLDTYTRLTAVTGFTSTAQTVSSITVGWTKNSIATKYIVSYRLVGNTSWTNMATLGDVATTTINGLAEETSYEIKIIAYNALGANYYSAETMITQ